MMMSPPVHSVCGACRGQRGFTLLEVLIALLVLSIGLLGLAALQVAGLKSSHNAYLSSQATLMAYDMADRIRAADRLDAGLGNYLYDGSMAGFGCDSLNQDVALGTADRDNWLNSVACYLPSGLGRVIQEAGGDYVVTVEWTDSQAEEQGETEWIYQLRVRL